MHRNEQAEEQNPTKPEDTDAEGFRMGSRMGSRLGECLGSTAGVPRGARPPTTPTEKE